MYKILLSLLLCINTCFTQNLNITNNSTHNTVASNTYTNITLGNNAVYNIQNSDVINVTNQVTTNNGSNIIVGSNATLTITGCLVANNNIQLTVLGTLIVGCINMQTNGTITINGGGDLQVQGNFTAAGGTDLIINFNGLLQVNGNVNINPTGSTTDIDGSFVVGGTYTGPAFNGDGTVTQGGNVVYPSALPVSLLYFTAESINNDVILNWSTASEHNNAYFVLQNSMDGVIYEFVCLTPGAGFSTQQLYYSYIDTEAIHEILYYKLYQVDYNGAITLYPVISVNNRIQIKYAIKYFNAIGQEVSSEADAMYILYSDGTLEKVSKKH